MTDIKSELLRLMGHMPVGNVTQPYSQSGPRQFPALVSPTDHFIFCTSYELVVLL